MIKIYKDTEKFYIQSSGRKSYRITDTFIENLELNDLSFLNCKDFFQLFIQKANCYEEDYQPKENEEILSIKCIETSDDNLKASNALKISITTDYQFEFNIEDKTIDNFKIENILEYIRNEIRDLLFLKLLYLLLSFLYPINLLIPIKQRIMDREIIDLAYKEEKSFQKNQQSQEIISLT